MAQSERATRDRQEEKVEEGRRQKKGHQTLSDLLKAPDEGMVGSQFEPSFDRHAAMLAGANNDTQRADLAIHLQQTYGNQYVQRLVESIKVQAKLTVSSPDDEYEREADQVADAVTRASASGVQRQVDLEEEEEEEGPEPVVEVRTKISGVQRQAAEPEEEELVAAKSAPEIQPSASPVLQRQEDIPGGPPKNPPKTTSDPKEIAGKVLEAASKTELGKKWTKKLKKAATSEEGIIIISALAVPALAVAFAEKLDVPQGLVGLVPEIAKFKAGENVEVSFQPIYKGKFGEKPEEWGGKVNLSIKF